MSASKPLPPSRHRVFEPPEPPPSPVARYENGAVAAHLMSGAERRERKSSFDENVRHRYDVGAVLYGSRAIDVRVMEMLDGTRFVHLCIRGASSSSIRLGSYKAAALLNLLSTAIAVAEGK